MNPETAKIVETELKQFAADLNLSETQKTQLRTAMEEAREKLDAIREKHPDATRADFIAKFQEVRGSLRERAVKFFTPEQLVKWDAGIARAKAFLGHPINT
jgi:hypothetical protein